MRPLLVGLLIVAALLGLAVPTTSALERGVVYSKIKETEDLNEAGEYGPPVGGLYTLRGKRPRRVTFDPADTEPNVARNGTIAFVRGGDVYLVRPDGTGLRQLTSGPEIDERPLFAPDGRSLVFARRGVEKGQRDLYLVGLDGVSPVALAKTPADESEAAFSLDGDEIAFASAGDLYAAKLGGGELRRLTDTPDGDSGPRYFVGGILFNRGRAPNAWPPDIYRMRRDGSKVSAVIASKGEDRISGVTANGRLLAFTSRGNYWSERLPARKGRKPKRLSGVYGGGELAISPDGRLGAFRLYFDEDFEIQTVNLLTGGFEFSADLYAEGDGIYIDPRLAW